MHYHFEIKPNHCLSLFHLPWVFLSKSWMMNLYKPVNFLSALSLVAMTLSACAGVEDRRDDAWKLAHRAGMNAQVIQESAFALQTFYRFGEDTDASVSPPLRVYIEGDGFAWISRYRVSPDPTPHNPVGLKLAVADRATSVIYIARPCQYIGVGSNPSCSQVYWTSHRFAREVIDSTNGVIDRAKKAAVAETVELIGYSGGGAVAILAAARRSDVVNIRTVAGNLDHVTLHRKNNVSQLTGSLNAADVAAQLSEIPQIHFVGADDDIIEPYVPESYRSRARSTICIEIQKIPGASHTSGWSNIWPNLLAMPLPNCK